MTAVIQFLLCVQVAPALLEPKIHHDAASGRITWQFGAEPLGTYVYRDDTIRRPYFCNVHAPGRFPLTRPHPPTRDELTDHATMHPGIWLAYGDLGGVDFWRNRGRVRHERFVQEPRGEPGKISFAVANVYESGAGKTPICRETVQYTALVRPDGNWLLLVDAEYQVSGKEVCFGDQEEMGLGIRLTRPLIEQKGGKIQNSAGLTGAKKAWGQQADWCDYHGTLPSGRVAGVTLFASSSNFRRSWFHARDYGLLVANPFGQNAFTRGAKSRVPVSATESLRLRFGFLLYSRGTEQTLDLPAINREVQRLLQAEKTRP